MTGLLIRLRRQEERWNRRDLSQLIEDQLSLIKRTKDLQEDVTGAAVDVLREAESNMALGLWHLRQAKRLLP